MRTTRSGPRTALAVLAATTTALLGATLASPASAASDAPIIHYTFDQAGADGTVPDVSGNGNTAFIKRNGAQVRDGLIDLPGGSSSSAPYVDIPTTNLVGKKDLTFSTWLSPRSGPADVAAAFVGAPVASGASYSSGYWLLDPTNRSGYVKSVVTNSVSGQPWGTEVGPGATNAATSGVKTPSGLSLYTTVIDGTNGTMTVYVNGARVQQTSIARNVSSFGNSLVAYIARSTYPDAGWSGQVDDYAVYDRALSGDQVSALYSGEAIDRAVASVKIQTSAIDDFALPASASGVSITWASNNPAIVVTNGTADVVRPSAGSGDASVLLTGTYTVGSQTRAVDYPVTVTAEVSDADKVTRDLAAVSIAQASDVRTNVSVPTTGALGSAFTWSVVSAGGATIRDGAASTSRTVVVDRPAAGSPAKEVVVRVTAKSASVTQTRDITLALQPLPTGTDDTEAYVWAFFTGEGDGAERVSLGASKGNDALAWNTLNDGRPVFTSTQGTQGLRDPFIVRSPEGDRFFMLATDLKIAGLAGGFDTAQRSGSKYIEVWESNDLVNWSEQRHVKVSTDFAGNTWAPEAYWDAELDTYVVFWASNMYPTAYVADRTAVTYNQMMYATTDDFVTFSPAKPWIDVKRGTGRGTIDSTVAKDGDTYYRFTKDEASMTLREERSTNLLATVSGSSLPGTSGPADQWTLIKERVASGLPNGEPNGVYSSGEGPNIFRANEGDVNGKDWFLFIDQPDYHGGPNHYVPFGSDDLANGDSWQPFGAKLRQGLPQNADGGKPRHGTVIPVTRAEYQKVLESYAPAIAVKSVAPVAVSTVEGAAPTLPGTASLTTAAGATSSVAVTWDAVAKESYAKPGTFTVKGIAQDASRQPVEAKVTVTSKTLNFTTTVANRCVSGKVVTNVTVRNGETFPVTVSIVTPSGTKSDVVVAAGKSTAAAFSTRLASIGAASVSATAKATVDGTERVTTQTVAYAAAGCQ